MTPRLIIIAFALLSQTGCVAAIPLATQLVSGANSTTQLCSLTKMPGEATSLCDRLGLTDQTPAAQTAPGTRKGVNTAAR